MFGQLFQPQADPAQMAQAYGVPEEVYNQLLNNKRGQTLTALGGTLLAASQDGQIGDRGRILASGMQNVSGAGNDFQRNLLNSSQMRLYADTLAQRREERERRAQLKKQIKSRQDLSPEQRQAAMADPFGFFQAEMQNNQLVQRQQMLAEAQMEQTLSQYEQADIPREVAMGLANGTITMETDFRGRPRLINIADLIQQAQQPGAGQEAPQEGPRSALFGAGPDGQPLDFSRPFGLAGAARRGANVVRDSFVGSLASEDTEIARSQLQNFHVNTVMEAQADIPGRPSNLTREMLRTLVPRPDSRGAATALTDYTTLYNRLKRERDDIMQFAESSGDAATYRHALDAVRRLNNIIADTEVILRGFGQQQEGAVERAVNNSPVADMSDEELLNLLRGQ